MIEIVEVIPYFGGIALLILSGALLDQIQDSIARRK